MFRHREVGQLGVGLGLGTVGIFPPHGPAGAVEGLTLDGSEGPRAVEDRVAEQASRPCGRTTTPRYSKGPVRSARR